MISGFPHLGHLPPPMAGMPPPKPAHIAHYQSLAGYGPAVNAIVDAEPGVMTQAAQVGILIEGPGARKEYVPYTLPKLTSSQEELIQNAKKFALEQSIKSVLVKQTIAHQQQQMQNFQSAVQRQQALALMCRVYIGSINFDIKEDTVKTAFLAFGPIKSIDLAWDPIANKHKGFAFIEYEIPEAAQLALEQMNNVLIGGRNVKVGRPSNMPQAQPIIAELQAEAKDFRRIYIASIHPDLTENDIQSVFEAFGTIKMCQLGIDPARPGKHRGYGYIEYENTQSAQDAVASMNLFDLGGQFLRVGKCITPPEALKFNTTFSTMPTASAVAAATITAKIAAMDVQQQMAATINNALVPPPGLVNPVALSLSTPAAPISSMVPPAAPALVIPPPVTQLTAPQLSETAKSLHQTAAVKSEHGGGDTAKSSGLTVAQKKMEDDPSQSLAQQENMEISGSNARHMVMKKLMRDSECTVMVLRNMVGVDDLDDELEHEVTEECGKFGHVEKVIIYQERQGEEEGAEVLVKIFVEFIDKPAVDAAINGLNNRYFGGRVVRAEKYDRELYDANDLSG